ncbi:tripartite tricarboxylate transporter permease [Devosia limi]|uniref:TctA family transporter n=2 Tax=Devosia limi DSM 17137 TaxID=1121477 RepID=A0A1M5G0U7_9HYPH|nr:tripartite tricarboxylate transporter permease [Devosia limi]SHF97420.1 TctA family transporter [Devosia limi DSM 17137]
MMDSFSNLFNGLSVALQVQNILYCFGGALIGTLIGVLPGLGPVATIAILLPVTFYLPPVAALVMLAGIYYGAQYGGSTTAILVNLPGESSSIVTCLDGYQMARSGRAGPALGIAALSSLYAGVITVFVMTIFATGLSEMAMHFGAAEYFSLMVLGLVAAVIMAQGSVISALAMVFLGLLLSLIGTDVSSGVQRMTFGMFDLSDGIDFVPLAMGLFAVAEIIKNLAEPEDRIVLKGKIGRLLPNWDDVRRSAPAATRGTILGSFLGLLPGGGPTLGSFAAYTLEKRLSKTPEKFGTGMVEGVAGPEAANNSSAQTSFIPLLTLGIPSNPTMAMMAGAMLIHGIQPGPDVMTKNPDIFWGLIASMLLGNVMLVIINLPLIGVWVSLLKIPYRLFYPAILVFCCIGAYSVNSNPFDIVVMIVFGFVGYAFMKWKAEPAPLILAFILGPLIEEYFRRAMLLSQGNPTTFISRPISFSLLLVSAALIGFTLLSFFRRMQRKEASA